ncbi:hypothetical protein C8F01DRAFT_1242165 [Mycena amicta]|nr:hypothetical protein C8F01DRAFT_1242165 [Mycena amicta]
MPRVSSPVVQHIPGFEGPLTSWTISPDSESDSDSDTLSESSTKNKSNSWANVKWLNSAGDGYGPHETTFGDIAAKIPSKPSLKKSCDNCGERPDQTGQGYSVCASCKVSRYCSRDCQTGHWKDHKALCKVRVKHAVMEEEVAAKALREDKVFVSNAVLRKWYYDNVDIVDYAITQTLELYKGSANSLWRTHAAVFSLKGGKPGTGAVTSNEIEFSDAQALSFARLARPDGLGIAPAFIRLVGGGTRIILVFMLNHDHDLMAVESHDLPEEEEWAAMERDEMWRMHIRMRGFTQTMSARV